MGIWSAGGRSAGDGTLVGSWKAVVAARRGEVGPDPHPGVCERHRPLERGSLIYVAATIYLAAIVAATGKSPPRPLAARVIRCGCSRSRGRARSIGTTGHRSLRPPAGRHAPRDALPRADHFTPPHRGCAPWRVNNRKGLYLQTISDSYIATVVHPLHSIGCSAGAWTSGEVGGACSSSPSPQSSPPPMFPPFAPTTIYC